MPNMFATIRYIESPGKVLVDECIEFVKNLKPSYLSQSDVIIDVDAERVVKCRRFLKKDGMESDVDFHTIYSYLLTVVDDLQRPQG